MERQGAFDYILLETTGLADPGNIAPIFWVDEGLGSTIYLDGIVTVVDAKNVLKSLEEPALEERVEEGEGHGQGPVLTTAHLQISHADILLLNKSDLVSAPQLENVKSRLQAINGLAKILPTTHGQIPQLEGILLDLHAYDSLSIIPDFSAKGHSHLDPSISTRSFRLPFLKTSSILALEVWLREVLWREGEGKIKMSDTAEVHRVKGILPLTDGSVKMLQGVREIFELIDSSHPAPVTSTENGDGGKIIMIGRRLESIETPSLE
jgi:G3E family GTPase